jgi:hypothetical protein
MKAKQVVSTAMDKAGKDLFGKISPFPLDNEEDQLFLDLTEEDTFVRLSKSVGDELIKLQKQRIENEKDEAATSLLIALDKQIKTLTKKKNELDALILTCQGKISEAFVTKPVSFADIPEADETSENKETKSEVSSKQFNPKAVVARLKNAAQAQEERQPRQLPMWPENVRGVPNGFLRSAIFSGKEQRGREQNELTEIRQVAALDGIAIGFAGERLDQIDLDLWENITHIARLQQLGEECRVTAYQLLRMLGKSDNGFNRAELHKSMIRLMANTVEVSFKGEGAFSGHLIQNMLRTKDKAYVIWLDPKILNLFGRDQFSHIDWAVRQSLGRNALAKWIHGFYSSHASPYPIKVTTLQELSGCGNMELRNFKVNLKGALKKVHDACKDAGQIFDFEIDQDQNVHINKSMTLSQSRHVTKKWIEKTKKLPMKRLQSTDEKTASTDEKTAEYR